MFGSVSGEDVLSVAAVGHPICIQLDPQLHKILQYRKEDLQGHVSINKRLVSVEAGARVSIHAAFKLGGRFALRNTRLGRLIGFGPGLSILAEATFFTRSIYKLNRQRKFDQITDKDYKRSVIKQTFTSTNMVIGVTAGAILGQIAIPIPGVGAAVGGTLGSLGGNGIGCIEGWAFSKLVRDDKEPTLPIILNLNYLEISKE